MINKKLAIVCSTLVIILLIPNIAANTIIKIDEEDKEPTFIGKNDGIIFYVGGSGPGNFSNIQDAIDRANDGDTVFVFDDSSPYKGLIRITKSINIIGEDKHTTIIKSNPYVDPVVRFTADWINFSGFTILANIEDFNDGIRIWWSDNNYVTDNIIIGMWQGITFTDSKNNIIVNNEFRECYRAIESYESTNNQISFNNFIDNKCGIRLTRNSIDNTINNNNLIKNGIEIWELTYPNNFYNNLINGKPLTYLENKSNLILDGINTGEIILINCSNIKIQNTVISNSTYGIELVNSDNCIISDNTLTNNRYYGLLLTEDSDNNKIENNDIVENYNGIFIGDYATYDCEENEVVKNNIALNFENGIYLSCTDENIVTKNTIQKNGLDWPHIGGGIYIWNDADRNNIFGNIIEDNKYGIVISDGTSNKISNNHIVNSTEIGIYLDRSSYHTKVTANNFINNTIHTDFVRYFICINTWRRNYWDDKVRFRPKIIWGKLLVIVGYDDFWQQFIYEKRDWYAIDWFSAWKPHNIEV
jgi:parallel beta-helix repeat protein